MAQKKVANIKICNKSTYIHTKVRKQLLLVERRFFACNFIFLLQQFYAHVFAAAGILIKMQILLVNYDGSTLVAIDCEKRAKPLAA